MSSFERKIRRSQIRGALLAQARANGCTCTPDITLPKFERGKVRVATVAHDNDCPHRRDPDSALPLVQRLNAGEFDLEAS